MRLVVIGGVAAGMSAAARARRIDKSLDIQVLEKGSQVSYGACGLPYYIEDEVRELESLVAYPAEYFRRERNIGVRTGAEVTAIHHSRRELRLAGGERVPYDRLVIATGASPDRGLIEGADQQHVFTLHSMADGARLKEHLRNRSPRRAVVVGAGYIGLECAEALRANGVGVTVLEASSGVLNREDPELTAFMKAHLERFGIELCCSQPVKRIESGQVNGIPCDMVMLAAGIRPNVGLAEEAGIEIGRTGAIRVNERMETNVLGVFAAGDCAETTHLVTNARVWIPLGTTANKMGRVAGACAAGARERFEGVTGTSIVRVCGLGFGLTGLSASQGRKEGFDAVSVSVKARDRAEYFRARPTTVELIADRRSRRLIGGSVIGERGVEGRINVIATALAARMKADEFEQLDLAYSPPFAAVWDPLLVAAQQLLKKLG